MDCAAGLGKSVFAAELIKRDAPMQMYAERGSGARHSNSIQGFFFCKHNDKARNSVRSVVKAFAYQLAMGNDRVKMAILESYRNPQSALRRACDEAKADDEDVQGLLKALITEPLHKAYT